MSGFTFGNTGTATQGASTPFSFGLNKTSAPTLTLPTANTSTGFSFGLNKTTAPTALLATPASTSTVSFGGFGSTPSTGGFSLGTQPLATSTVGGFSLGTQPLATSTVGGFSLGTQPISTTTTSGFSLGAQQPSTSTAPLSQGFGFGKPPTTSAPSFGASLLGTPGTTTSTNLSLGLGGSVFGTAASASSAGASIFSSLPLSTSTSGLGGVDPNTVQKSGSSAGLGAASDGKTLKESVLPELLTATVEPLLKYVKEEKAVREDIARMSSKPMIKVQEDVTALRQLLSVVANGLQRNACSVEKLKQEMTQKLKNAEMAQRTKEIPAGLQYENTAPTEYFQRLVEEFEERMVTYRQQIETLDSHLAALHQSNPHTPSEVLSLLKKLHETFISLAAQLQQVHEAVKSQKEQFLTYRRVVHGDAKNIFYKPAPVTKSIKRSQLSDLAGPNPFPGTTNAAAHAMAMVHTRAQQPQGPPVASLIGSTPTFASGIFGGNKPSTGLVTGSSLSSGGASIGGVGNLFSSTLSPAGFGTPPTLGASTTAALNLAGTNTNMSANTKQPFQLQKPPQGAKRGKR
ncbi:nucleoporin p58/p45-like isoform X1 [Biomphalaria glabrata]|uniref:Nucleoporin p58/p45-like isoform X1 n=1 Tax=Biomphalaria glabrata TaxID=6526 RepID=A0A9W3B6B6_BIOGL|nr:nucleoporin p58/p45-like isoform X1 [Biomphalaria glabrata]KAI8756997.1 nucleoporin p58/p45-like isoform X1 [Biomphalaria glabrata]